MDAVQELRNSSMLTVDDLRTNVSVIKQINQDIAADKADVNSKISELTVFVKDACVGLNQHADILNGQRKVMQELGDADRVRISDREKIVKDLMTDNAATKSKLKELVEENVSSESSSAKRQKKA